MAATSWAGSAASAGASDGEIHRRGPPRTRPRRARSSRRRRLRPFPRRACRPRSQRNPEPARRERAPPSRTKHLRIGALRAAPAPGADVSKEGPPRWTRSPDFRVWLLRRLPRALPGAESSSGCSRVSSWSPWRGPRRNHTGFPTTQQRWRAPRQHAARTVTAVRCSVERPAVQGRPPLDASGLAQASARRRSPGTLAFPIPARGIALQERPDLAALLGVVAIGAAFFAPSFDGRWPVVRDLPGFLMPSRALWRREVLAGHLPAWNPFVGIGVASIAAPVHGTFSPFRLLLLLGRIVSSLPALLGLHAVIAGAGAYALGRVSGARPLGASAAAVAWMLGGYAVSMWGDGEKVLSGAWVPLAAAAIVRAAQGRSLAGKRVAVAAGVLALVALAGNPSSGSTSQSSPCRSRGRAPPRGPRPGSGRARRARVARRSAPRAAPRRARAAPRLAPSGGHPLRRDARRTPRTWSPPGALARAGRARRPRQSDEPSAYGGGAFLGGAGGARDTLGALNLRGRVVRRARRARAPLAREHRAVGLVGRRAPRGARRPHAVPRGAPGGRRPAAVDPLPREARARGAARLRGAGGAGHDRLASAPRLWRRAAVTLAALSGLAFILAPADLRGHVELGLAHGLVAAALALGAGWLVARDARFAPLLVLVVAADVAVASAPLLPWRGDPQPAPRPRRDHPRGRRGRAASRPPTAPRHGADRVAAGQPRVESGGWPRCPVTTHRRRRDAARRAGAAPGAGANLEAGLAAALRVGARPATSTRRRAREPVGAPRWPSPAARVGRQRRRRGR